MISNSNLELNEHKEIYEKHAVFAPSQFYWINYDPEKLLNFWDNRKAQEVGTYVHDSAARLIQDEYYFRENNVDCAHISLRGKDSYSRHVMHSIKHGLTPEAPVKYSDICFGHADALGYDLNKHILRINDLKTGKIPGHMEQLEIYAALFFGEYWDQLTYGYQIDPYTTSIELRIFQFNDEVLTTPSAQYIIDDVLGRIKEQHEILSDGLARRGE